jgi:GTP pyrophosphokinase
MGMQWMREELEDLSFKVLMPDARQSVIRRFITLQDEADTVIRKIVEDIRELWQGGHRGHRHGRAKKPYSIWRKLQTKDQAFSRLSDIYGFRIDLRTAADCYRILGAVHQRWRAVPGGSRTTSASPSRTDTGRSTPPSRAATASRSRCRSAPRRCTRWPSPGVAAHWSYKDGVRAENRFAVDPVRWIAQMTERLDEGHDHGEFLEAVKLEMYQDQVFCFTPKGHVIPLPSGATPIDFAYAIHTRIGHACVGAKVDGVRVPLYTRLRNGRWSRSSPPRADARRPPGSASP